MRTLEELRAWVASAPAGTTVPVESLNELLAEEVSAPAPGTAGPALVEDETAADSWRIKLWAVPSETRLGVLELSEALGRSRGWVYRAIASHRYRSRSKPGERKPCDRIPNPHPLPHKRLDGRLVFEAGQVRRWLEAHETSSRK